MLSSSIQKIAHESHFRARIYMETIRLESHEWHVNRTAKKIVQRCRQRAVSNPKVLNYAVTTLMRVFGIPRAMAVAILFCEVEIREVGPNETLEFNWPNNGSLEAW